MTGRGFAVYVHWPFCESKCPYCDFNSHVRDSVDQSAWRAALLGSLESWAAETPGRTVASVFFGGGTPSLMAPETAGAVLERVRALWPAADDLEVTLEANPGSVEAGRFRAFAAAGVNRLSLGVQSFRDEELAFLGRRHDARTARAALELAHRTFPRVSFDLIYALPGHTAAEWAGRLDEALELAGEHLSLYQLTIEPGTAFAPRAARGDFRIPDEDEAAALYETTQERMAAAGLPGYEISNHARPGAACRHNLVYWRGGEWIGVGPGAHGRIDTDEGRVATEERRAPEPWLAEAACAGRAVRERRLLTALEAVQERIQTGLRLAEGIPAEGLEPAIDMRRLAHLRDEALLCAQPDRLQATAAGQQRLDAVIRYLLI